MILGIDIYIPPGDTYGPLNTISIFNCEGRGDVLVWNVEGNTITKAIKLERNIEINTTKLLNNSIASKLHIAAKPINDDIIIGCTIVSYELNEAISKGAKFYVLGISPVTNLQLLNTSFIIWDPPSFSSDNDYHYNIIIEVNNEYITVNETTQDLKYIPEIETCDLYIINVSAVSLSYSSTPEMIQHFYGCKADQ